MFSVIERAFFGTRCKHCTEALKTHDATKPVAKTEKIANSHGARHWCSTFQMASETRTQYVSIENDFLGQISSTIITFHDSFVQGIQEKPIRYPIRHGSSSTQVSSALQRQVTNTVIECRMQLRNSFRRDVLA